MTITQFLALFPTVKETKKGWDVQCPAHDDRSPSLGVMEGEGGRIVLNCWAGCQPRQICETLGIGLSDLFADAPITGRGEPMQRKPKKINRNKLAFNYDLHAFDLRRQAARILSVSAQCQDCDTWTSDDRDLAMNAVSRAYTYQARAEFCETYADHVREQEYESKRSAFSEP